ncbi:unnamed protein product [Moneuplotes crassus]|uniref:Uncharacterized protein n=2 Tax=Euplotes crassus TaxID=5936 RepID=A0AAD1X9Z0_EUPCR|nr:unnamed protein product [Moneuplotes crassus]
MGNKIPKTYSEFERNLHKKQNNLTAKEHFVQMLKSKGMLNSINCKEDSENLNKEIYKILFSDLNKVKSSKTGFHGASPELSLEALQKKSKITEGEHSGKIFIVKYGDDLPDKAIIVNKKNHEEQKDPHGDGPNELTCGWLISEVIRTYEEYFEKRSESLTSQDTQYCSKLSSYSSPRKDNSQRKLIIGLKVAGEGYNLPIDFYLTQFDLPLSRLPDYLELNAQYSCLNRDHRKFLSELLQEKHKVSIEDFEFLHVIGKGGYSKVVAARKNDSGRIYAIKIMEKTHINSNFISESIVVNERNIHFMFTNDPFFIDIYWAFQDKDHYYLVTEMCIGGSLYNLLSTHDPLDENLIRFYASQILIMIKRMHDKNIIYRDLKPENILIDSSGYLKLADFGLAKIVSSLDKLNDTFCGSPEYMAPEMLLGDSHNLTLDFYTFGCLLHEMVSAFPPHYSRNREEMNNKIMLNSANLNFDCSKELKQLINWCLHKNRDLRPQSVEKLCDHAFFKGVDWAEIEARNTKAPWIPSLINHFNPKFTDIKIVNNTICEDAKADENFNSRTSVRIEREDCNETIKLLQEESKDKENEFSKLLDYINGSALLKEVYASNNIRTPKRARENTAGFEIENLPLEEVYFRKYFIDMFKKSKKQKLEGLDGSLNTIKESDSSLEVSKCKEYDEKYLDGTVSEIQEAPIMKIQSFDEVKQRTTSFDSEVDPQEFELESFDESLSEEDDLDNNFGPHIDQLHEIEQKNFESTSYLTPLIEPRELETPKIKVPLGNIFEEEYSKEEEGYTLIKIQEAASENYDSSQIMVQKLSPKYEGKHNLSPNNSYEDSPIINIIPAVEQPALKIQRSAQGIESVRISESFGDATENLFLTPLKESKTLFYVNDLSSVESSTSPHSNKKRVSPRKKKVKNSSTVSSTIQSVFDRDSLIPAYGIPSNRSGFHRINNQSEVIQGQYQKLNKFLTESTHSKNTSIKKKKSKKFKKKVVRCPSPVKSSDSNPFDSVLLTSLIKTMRLSEK